MSAKGMIFATLVGNFFGSVLAAAVLAVVS
jgi:hypothetical protein